MISKGFVFTWDDGSIAKGSGGRGGRRRAGREGR